MNKIAKFIQSDSASSRLKLMKSVLWSIKFVNEHLLNPLETLVKQNSRLDDEDQVIMLEHYTTKALREIPVLEKELKELKESLRTKIDWMKKQTGE